MPQKNQGLEYGSMSEHLLAQGKNNSTIKRRRQKQTPSQSQIQGRS
jgi:hypothetical protein